MATATTASPSPLKCVHKGCGKLFTDPDEPCHYHPGGPEFHEGQKGWRCCKPRVLTFDEFLAIPPCTTGTHSTVDSTPGPDDAKKARQAKDAEEQATAAPIPVATADKGATVAPTHVPTTVPTESTATPTPQSQEPKKEERDETDYDDDPSLPIPPNATCRRRACDATFNGDQASRDTAAEKCVHHPGVPIFHEGSKGWSCCKRRVLEFDQFLKIGGCAERAGHQFVGRKRDAEEEEVLGWEDVKTDFYQTEGSLTFTIYLKNIDKEGAVVEFPGDREMALDLPVVIPGGKKRFRHVVPLLGGVVAGVCSIIDINIYS
ncbi:hypothetical protein KEM55_006782 [Ascosphaera atra]|nr:hypothetical protein KEM55_006782 [Ascosphaera atra]